MPAASPRGLRRPCDAWHSTIRQVRHPMSRWPPMSESAALLVVYAVGGGP